jgi:hypothetical protein
LHSDWRGIPSQANARTVARNNWNDYVMSL